MTPDDQAILKTHLERIIQNWQQNPGVRYYPKIEIEAFQRILDGLTPGVSRIRELPSESESRKIKAQILVLCGQHPNYTGQRKPRTGCRGCWAGYERLKNG